MSRRVVITPHTHWDREWYSSFQTFRLRLVDMLDEFLPLLIDDPSYRHFHLDGQMAVVDDYLEIRPEAEAVLLDLARQGRLSMGPWYTQPDEFLVSGETHIRNLRRGISRAEQFGALMDIGYLPDMFGHIAQMPQILRGFGFDHAVVWRGVPSAIESSGFWWESPSGHRVRAEYLWGGYFNAERIKSDPGQLVERTRRFDAQHGSRLRGAILLMNGMDHQVPQADLGSTVAAANSSQDVYRFEIGKLTDYLRAAPVDGLPTWRGELRSGARCNLLMGVTSNRVDVRQLAATAERCLEREVEPLLALFGLPWPARALDVAWHRLILNSAHDSICACSADEVVRAVVSRYEEAIDIGNGLAQRGRAALAREFANPGWVALNMTNYQHRAVVEVEVPGPHAPPGAQVLESRDSTLLDLRMSGEALRDYLPLLRSQEFAEGHFINSYSLDSSAADVVVSFAVHPTLLASLDIPALRREIVALIDNDPSRTFHVTATQAPLVRALVQTAPLPAFGWAAISDDTDGTHDGAAPHNPVEIRAEHPRLTLTNGLVEVEIHPDGTFTLDGVGPHGAVVESGDAGDTYNYSPPPQDREVRDPRSVSVDVVERGPLRTRVRIVRDFVWPTHEHDRARAGEGKVSVTSTLEIRADEPFVRLEVSWNNAGFRDHRVRVEFATGTTPLGSSAECVFAVVDRGLDAEGGPHERALATYPSRRFVSAGSTLVSHDRVTEYEVLAESRVLAVTALRGTAWLSRADMIYRPMPAGPAMPLDGSQMQVPVTLTYCVANVASISGYELAERAWLEPHVLVAPGGGHRGDRGSALPIHGRVEVCACENLNGHLNIRVLNPSAYPETVEIDRSWRRVDLRGRALHDWESPGRAEVGPAELVTFQFA